MSIRCDNCFAEYNGSYSECPHCGHVKHAHASERIYLDPGTVLRRRYAVGQVVGSGGFGIIYKAWDKKENKIVAVKEFFQSGLVSRAPDTQQIFLVARNRVEEFMEGKQRFLEEALQTREFAGHPNIVAMLDAFEENNTAYHVMEFLQGSTLGSFVEQKALTVNEKLDIVFKIGYALRDVHKAGILHRDISPDNIIVPKTYPDGDIKLLDFGAARFSKHEKDSLQTRVMKPGYSPPEQYGPGSGQNEQIDVYALGATLYFLLTGLVPEEATNRKIEDNLPPPAALNNEVPVKVSNAVLTSMALEMHLRFRTIEEFLAAMVAEEPVLAPKEKMKKLRKKRRKTILVASAILAAGLAIVTLLYAREIERTTLPDASINLLYAIGGDEAADGLKQRALESMAEDFMSIYPNVSVSVRGIALSEYADEVEAYMSRGDYPAVFESTMLDPGALGRALDVSGVIGGEQRDASYFLGNYARLFPDRRRMPVGFRVSAFYINRQLSSFEGAGVSDVVELLASMPFSVAEQGVSCSELHSGEFRAVYGDSIPLASRDGFISDSAGVYFSDTAEYFSMLAEMPGRFRMLYVEGNGMPAGFNNLWSVMPGSSAEQKVALRFLQYMLDENAQYFLHISGQSGSLPINRLTYTAYVEVYADFKEFLLNIE